LIACFEICVESEQDDKINITAIASIPIKKSFLTNLIEINFGAVENISTLANQHIGKLSLSN